MVFWLNSVYCFLLVGLGSIFVLTKVLLKTAVTSVVLGHMFPGPSFKDLIGYSNFTGGVVYALP